jgi:DNA (cytosine-5)-methyltransferase 1
LLARSQEEEMLEEVDACSTGDAAFESEKQRDSRGPLEQYLRRRRQGWAQRIDSPKKPRARREKEKSPQVSRYTKVQQDLEQSLLNGRRHYVDTGQIRDTSPEFDCIDLFSGCGGLSLGFLQAGFRSRLAVEMDKDAVATYRRNFPGTFVWDRRIEELPNSEIRKIVGERVLPVLCAGFPCQGFSVAGKRDPTDPRNELFYEVVRVARELQPWFVVMENVPGVVTMGKGRVFEAIRKEFGGIGYKNLSCLILESANFGVPQFRPRAVFVANRLGLSNPYPRPLLDSKNLFSIEAAIDDLKNHPRDESINHDWTYHSPQMEKRLAEVEPGGSLYESFFDAWKRQYRGVPSMTIKENHGGVHIHYELNRTLSAREMARLQSFPDSFFFCGRMKRVMFQVGNAVPPQLAKNVALALRPILEQLTQNGVEKGLARGSKRV